MKISRQDKAKQRLFLSDERRTKLIEILKGVEQLPHDLAEDLASAPDDLSIIDIRLTGHTNRAAESKEQIDAGDTSRIMFMMINIIILCLYMQEVEERELDVDDLPLLNAAFDAHNIRWENARKGKLN